MTNITRLREQAQRRFLEIWTQRATVTRPDGTPQFDAGTGTYTDTTTTVATGMVCSLQSESVPETVDVAGDPQVQTRLELKHDPSVTLKVDDRVTFTTHDNGDLVGDTFYVVGVGEAYEHVYGVAFVQRAEPDSGS